MKALISVSDKSGIIELAQGLVALGWEIISTGGTYELLQKQQIPVIPIQDVTGFPEMLDGRVKTLHPKIHGGLLALRNHPDHMATCEAHQIGLIDLVVVNLYPFEQTISKPNVTLEEAIENIDIGGPSMLRSASKNYASVGVVVNPSKYQDILAELKSNQNKLSLKTKQQLALAAFQHTAMYDARIADYLVGQFNDAADYFPNYKIPVYQKISDLRYGENPHQKAAFYKIRGQGGLPETTQIHGKELSYNNILDLDSAWAIAREFSEPAVTIIKHTNPCGTAVGKTILDAYQKAYAADPASAYGSIIGMNRALDIVTAKELSTLFVEAIIAPSYDADALDILTQKSALRLIKTGQNFYQPESDLYRHVIGGMLIQTPNSAALDTDQFTIATISSPTDMEFDDLLFAFQIVKHVKSNAIVVANSAQTLGVGAGQMSRVDSVKIALEKAGEKAKGAVLASDAFFPFADSVELMAAAGIRAVIQPGGSKRDQESIDAANKYGIAMVLTHTRFFKH